MSGVPGGCAGVLARGSGVLMVLLATACGAPSQDTSVGVTPHPPVNLDSEWPKAVTAAESADALSVESALRSLDGSQIKVRAYLVALPAPCPACNVGADRGTETKVEGHIGKTARRQGPDARGPDMPGCVQCPPSAATFRDAPAGVQTAPSSVPLRATAAAEALQQRHLGRVFVLTGTFHAQGGDGPELEVTDVRAVTER